jgi:pilus assembly protein CpaE
MDKLNIVVLSEDIDLRIHVKNHLLGDDIVISGYSDFDSAGKLKTVNLFPDVVIGAVKGEVPDKIFDFVQQLLINAHNCVVVLVNDNINVELVNKAAQFGIRAVLSFDDTPEEFENNIKNIVSLEIQRTIDTNEGKKVRSKVLGFFGGKGGTGKTTISVNIASVFAKMGKRVILVDLDLQFGDVALALDLEPKDTIVELVQDRGGISIENINSFSMVHSTGMNVLCAPKSPEFAEFVSGENIETIIDVLRPYYEYIILDLPPAFNDVSIAAVENSDEIYLVYNMDILSLKNAKTSINVLEQLQQRDKTRLIINKNSKGLIKVRDFEKMLDMEVIALISTDAKMAIASVNKGMPVMIAQPRSEIARDIQRFADRLLEIHSGIKPLGAKEKKSREKAERKAQKNKSKLEKSSRQNRTKL